MDPRGAKRRGDSQSTAKPPVPGSFGDVFGAVLNGQDDTKRSRYADDAEAMENERLREEAAEKAKRVEAEAAIARAKARREVRLHTTERPIPHEPKSHRTRPKGPSQPELAPSRPAPIAPSSPR